jgi:hypothetical protein
MTNPYSASQSALADDNFLDDGIVELTTDVSASPYYNPDVAPTTRAERKWGVKDVAALWVGMCACIPSYMLASGLIKSGMNWWQAALTVTLGNVIILVPMMLNAHAGTKFGIPFPVYCRVSFGIRGANVAAMLRALVACGWFGIQTWIGGQGLYIPLKTFFPDVANSPQIFEGANAAELGCFLAFWALTIYLIYAGMERIRLFMVLATPILIAVPILLLGWAFNAAGGLEPILTAQQQLNTEGQNFWALFVPGLTAIVGFWSTLALNIPDFMRYAKSQRAQMTGQALGLPTTMGLYALVGVLVTSATIVGLRRSDLGPDRAARTLQRTLGAGRRPDRTGRGDTEHQHRGECRRPGQRFCEPGSALDQFQDRRVDHGHHRHRDPAVAFAAGREPLFRLAHGVFVATWSDLRHSHRRLFLHPPALDRSAGALSTRRQVLVPRRLQPHRARVVRGRGGRVLARISRPSRCANHAGRFVLAADVRLRVVCEFLPSRRRCMRC